MSVDQVIARARHLLGTPFRLHGRSAQTGLDCVGLIAEIFEREAGVPNGYALRNDLEPRWIVYMDAQFVRRDATAPAAGDILLLRAGPAQFHLGLWSGQGLIHADARLRRVVEWPGLPDWPLIGLWHAG
jgi:murein DD-endopeptidase / murein LD-carboxypeptidase